MKVESGEWRIESWLDFLDESWRKIGTIEFAAVFQAGGDLLGFGNAGFGLCAFGVCSYRWIGWLGVFLVRNYQRFGRNDFI